MDTIDDHWNPANNAENRSIRHYIAAGILLGYKQMYVPTEQGNDFLHNNGWHTKT